MNKRGDARSIAGEVQFSTAEFRQNLREVLGRVHYGNEIAHITNHGKPFATVISPEDADLLRAIKEKFGSNSPLDLE